MGRVPTGRAGKRVALAHPAQSAPAAILAGVSRIDFGHRHARLLGLTLCRRANKLALPLRQTSQRALPAPHSLPRLGHRQRLEHEHGMCWRPLDQLLPSRLCKGAGAIASFAAKPFEQTPRTAGVLMLCLTGRVFLLDALAGLVGALVGDLDSLATHEKGVAVRIDSHQRIRLVEVYPNRQDAPWLRNLQCDRHSAKQSSVTFDDGQAVNLLRQGQRFLEGIRHDIGDALASGDCPDREGAILAEVCISPTDAHQEQSTGVAERERAYGWLAVALGTSVRACRESDSRAGHLAIDGAAHLRVHLP